jgi:ribosomal protein S18 acetylase RimI-like enzyme
MSDFASRPFRRDHLKDLLALVTLNARHRWPQACYMMNSDIAWRLPGSNAKENLRLWYDDQGIAAYAWFETNSPISMDVRFDLKASLTAEIGEEMLSWLESRRLLFTPLNPWSINLNNMQDWEQALIEGQPSQPGSDTLLQVSAFDTDVQRIRLLQTNGYEPTQHFHYSMSRSLDTPIPAENLPDGMTVRHVLIDDYPERVATHRDSWLKSSFDIETYLGVRSLDIFDPELDIVAESADGIFGSYCIGWTDQELGIGSFEPVGTRPAFRRMGLGQQVNYEGLRRMKEKGMHSAKIGTAGFNDRAFGLYSSCGFDLVDRERTYIKVLL